MMSNDGISVADALAYETAEMTTLVCGAATALGGL